MKIKDWSILLTGVICIALLAVFLRSPEYKHVPPLSAERIHHVLSQIGHDGFDRLLEVNCLDAMSIRFETGVWDDKWCADAYGHLDFNHD